MQSCRSTMQEKLLLVKSYFVSKGGSHSCFSLTRDLDDLFCLYTKMYYERHSSDILATVCDESVWNKQIWFADL